MPPLPINYMLRNETKEKGMFHVKRDTVSKRNIHNSYKAAKVDYSIIAAALYKQMQEERRSKEVA